MAGVAALDERDEMIIGVINGEPPRPSVVDVAERRALPNAPLGQPS